MYKVTEVNFDTKGMFLCILQGASLLFKCLSTSLFFSSNLNKNCICKMITEYAVIRGELSKKLLSAALALNKLSSRSKK